MARAAAADLRYVSWRPICLVRRQRTKGANVAPVAAKRKRVLRRARRRRAGPRRESECATTDSLPPAGSGRDRHAQRLGLAALVVARDDVEFVGAAARQRDLHRPLLVAGAASDGG